jgi:hypothetical protein
MRVLWRICKPRTTSRRFGDLAWIVFVSAQAADGVLTYVGIATLGTHVEANPLLAWCIAAVGVGAPLLGAKVFALACGALLHLQAMHGVLALLTAVYIAVAVWPWTIVLWPIL